MTDTDFVQIRFVVNGYNRVTIAFDCETETCTTTPRGWVSERLTGPNRTDYSGSQP